MKVKNGYFIWNGEKIPIKNGDVWIDESTGDFQIKEKGVIITMIPKK